MVAVHKLLFFFLFFFFYNEVFIFLDENFLDMFIYSQRKMIPMIHIYFLAKLYMVVISKPNVT